MRQGKLVRFIKSIGKHIAIYFCLAVTFFPFLWMILASLQSQNDIMNSAKGLFNFVPSMKNYLTVFQQYSFVTPILNSAFVAIAATICALMLGLPAAYAIARFRMNKMGMIVLVVRMIPGITFLVPWFTIFTKIGLIDTYTSLVLSHMLVALPFIVWIMVPFFESLPRELEEAAWVDGSSQVGAFFFIVLKLSMPGILTASLLSIIFSWNNFMFSLVLSGSKTITLPIAIFSFVSYASVDWGGLMAAAVVITLPIIALSICLQKYIVGGLTAGAVKG
ncbi:MAG: carbohydrate ABC transporter permease [Oscillospiraceae bacterium]